MTTGIKAALTILGVLLILAGGSAGWQTLRLEKATARVDALVKDVASAKADTARWTHLAMVVQDSTVRLYVGGVLSDSGTYWDPDASAKHAGAFHIGYTVDTTGTDAQHFYGAIDEAWVQARVRSSDWIRFAAGNQNPAAPRARALSR